MASTQQYDEKFTHLIDLYDVLSKQSLSEMQHLCNNNFLSLLNNDYKLFAQIIFHGMHHLLYKIDTDIIHNIKNNLSIKTHKNTKSKNTAKQISKLPKKMDYIPPKLIDIPSDVMSFVICSYLDLNALLSFEKVSKLILIRCRSARISEFDLNLSKFYAFTNTSYGLLRFKNTSKLKVTINGTHDYNHPYNNNRNTNDIHPYSVWTQFSANTEYRKLLKQVLYRRDRNKQHSSLSTLNNVWLKAPSKSERNVIMSQLKQFYNLSHLIIECNVASHSHIDVINNMINNLPSFDSLRKLKVLEIKKTMLQSTNLMLSKLNYINIYEPAMIEKLYLFQLNINIEGLNIINDCMINLNEIYLHSVTMEVAIDTEDIDINIEALLMRLRTISINVKNIGNTAQNTRNKTVESPVLTQLFMIGDSRNCSKPHYDDSYSIPLIAEEIKCVSDRKYLETLHLHYHDRTHLDAVNYSVAMFSNLIELGIDCTHWPSSSSSTSVSDIIEKCKKLQRLSLIFDSTFLNPFLFFDDENDRNMDENDINRFNKLCDSFMINNTTIKHLRISLHDRNERILSMFIVTLMKYIKNKEIYKWRKFDSFQFVSKRNMDWNENNQITITTLDNMKEFDLLNCIKDMIDNEYAVTFKGVNSCLYELDILNALWIFCNEKDSKYKIKIENSENKSYKGKRNDKTLIDIHIGKWNDKIHRNEETLFDFWSIDCHSIR